MLQTFTSNGSWTRTNNTNAGGFRHDRVYCIAIGGGGGGATLGGGGGGGAAWGAINMQGAGGNTLQITVGSGGGFGSGSSADDGGNSQVRVGSNNNYRVRGEGGKGAARFNSDLGTDNSDGGGRTVSGVFNGGGSNGDDGWFGILNNSASGTRGVVIATDVLRGGAAGGANGGGQGFRVNNDSTDPEDGTVTTYAGGGGDGSTIKAQGSGGSGNPIQDNNNGQNAFVTINSPGNPEDPYAEAGDGGNRGGGGGGLKRGAGTGFTGVGRNGICYVTFLNLDNFPSTVLNGQSFTIRKKSYWDGNQNVSFTASGSGIQSFTLTDSRGNRSTAFIEVLQPPTINSFTAQDQLSLSGIPSDGITFSWSLSNPSGLAFTVEIFKGADNPSNLIYTTTNSLNGSAFNVSTGLQSVASSNSPATATFRLKVSIAGGANNQATTIGRVYNDNVPSNITVSNVTTLGAVPINSLESGELYSVLINYDGTDMPVICGSGSSNTRSSLNNSSWTSGTVLVPNSNKFFYIEFTSNPFNPSTVVGGVNNEGLAIGQTSSRTITYFVGPTPGSFTITTRAPVLEEVFDQEGVPPSPNSLPNPDVDTITPEPSTTQYIVSGLEGMDDIEVDVEIKTDDPDAQVSINGNDFQDMRQI